DDGDGLGDAVIARLQMAGAQAIALRQGSRFQRIDDSSFALDPSTPDGFTQLASLVCAGEPKLSVVIHCWSPREPGGTDLDDAARTTLLTPMRLVHALGGESTVRPLPLMLVARGATRVLETDVVDPPRALGAGLAKVLPQEHPGMRVAHVDVDGSASVGQLLVDELAAGAREPNVALRNGRRFVETYEHVVLPSGDSPLGLP